MERMPIAIDDLNYNNFSLFNEWLLLTAGDFSKKSFNAMTVSWGTLGIMWGRPIVQVVVRPTRFTFKFMEQNETFTVSSFASQHKNALSILGSKSGRDSSKMTEAKLTPVASTVVAAPGFKEARLVFECKKIYWHDFDPSHFLADFIGKQYKDDYHRSYFGEVVAITGTEEFVKK